MDETERICACYQHPWLQYVVRQPMTYASLREHPGIDARNASTASRLPAEAVAAGRIVSTTPSQEAGTGSCLPFWA